MRIKLDENIGRQPTEFLRRSGHDVMTVHEQALSGAAAVRGSKAGMRQRITILLLEDLLDGAKLQRGTGVRVRSWPEAVELLFSASAKKRPLATGTTNMITPTNLLVVGLPRLSRPM